MTAKRFFFISATILLIANALLCLISFHFAWGFVFTGFYAIIGVHDLLQPHHNILRNYPFFGHFRYILESIRPEMQQYFVATNLSERPFPREARSLVYRRAHHANDTVPFGTQHDISKEGFELALHSMTPTIAKVDSERVLIGNEACKQPYSASRLNISAMSFGALGRTAIESLNLGAKLGNFYHNTGEGGLTPHHLKNGGDVVWQLGTGYFGCRTKNGEFCESLFKEKVVNDAVKMIEIKISQGAKPSHGGLLPATKISKEVSDIRGIPMGKDCFSPPTHSAFSDPKTLLAFVSKLRELSGGKPVGFKLAIGQKHQFMAICKAMIKEQVYPDFITVDGAEGGTGAAPAEFSNRLGLPINDGLIFVHNCLKGCNIRDKIRIIASGKVISAFDIVQKLSIGADLCNSARGMLFSIGCIQARRCNTNECPTGIATQDPNRIRAIIPEIKSEHVNNYHKVTIESFLELMGAMGVDHPSKLTPEHVQKRTDYIHSKTYAELYPFLNDGDLLKEQLPQAYEADWLKADSSTFH